MSRPLILNIVATVMAIPPTGTRRSASKRTGPADGASRPGQGDDGSGASEAQGAQARAALPTAHGVEQRESEEAGQEPSHMRFPGDRRGIPSERDRSESGGEVHAEPDEEEQ